MDCCAVCEFFDGYLCRGEESPLYKRDVDPTAKCPAFVGGASLQENRQVVAVESTANGKLDIELEVDSIERIDLDLEEENEMQE